MWLESNYGYFEFVKIAIIAFEGVWTFSKGISFCPEGTGVWGLEPVGSKVFWKTPALLVRKVWWVLGRLSL